MQIDNGLPSHGSWIYIWWNDDKLWYRGVVTGARKCIWYPAQTGKRLDIFYYDGIYQGMPWILFRGTSYFLLYLYKRLDFPYNVCKLIEAYSYYDVDY